MDTCWPKARSNTELWQATVQKPVILQIRMRKWRRIGHTLRKGDESTGKQALIWNPQRVRRRARPQQTRKRAALRKQENAANME
jgi:hypothetical protein